MVQGTMIATIPPAAGGITTVDALVPQLHALSEGQPFHSGWYFKDLRGGVAGAAADRHGHVVVPSASTRKIAILMAALKAVHEGTLSLDQPVTIEARYQISNSGCFQHFRPGFTITLHDGLVMMIIVSDNACTGTVADMVGLDAVNALCRSIGMRGTTHREGIPRWSLLTAAGAPGAAGSTGSPAAGEGQAGEGKSNETTPADVGLLLDLILQGTTDPAAAGRLGSTPELCRLGLDILSWQKLNARLPFLLPLGTRVAHKTGTGARCYNDAGIVFQGDRPLFILAAYTNEVPRALPDGTSGAAAAALLIARLARTCWDALAEPEAA
jgi:beta-lactamase class A